VKRSGRGLDTASEYAIPGGTEEYHEEHKSGNPVSEPRYPVMGFEM
jgi:hypothetical protein